MVWELVFGAFGGGGGVLLRQAQMRMPNHRVQSHHAPLELLVYSAYLSDTHIYAVFAQICWRMQVSMNQSKGCVWVWGCVCITQTQCFHFSLFNKANLWCREATTAVLKISHLTNEQPFYLFHYSLIIFRQLLYIFLNVKFECFL